MAEVGYRTGKITDRKSDYLCQFSNASRSTGYFGTGYYFCTRPERCITITRENNELFELKFKEGLNWLFGTIDIHETLKHITAFVKCFKFVHDFSKLKKLDRALYRLNNYVHEFSEGEEVSIVDYLNTEYEADKEYELCSDFKSFIKNSNSRYEQFLDDIFEIDELKPFVELLLDEDFNTAKDFIKEHSRYFNYIYVDSMKELYENTIFEVNLRFGISEKAFLNWAKAAYDYFNANLNSQVDSISTKFLKRLGYDGVWPSKECDNTTYGGVVFEKENIEEIQLLAMKAKDWEGIKENVKLSQKMKIAEKARRNLKKSKISNSYRHLSNKNLFDAIIYAGAK